MLPKGGRPPTRRITLHLAIACLVTSGTRFALLLRSQGATQQGNFEEHSDVETNPTEAYTE